MASSSRRVAITGIGPLTPIGNGVDGLWAGVRRGESAVRRISRFDPSPFSAQVAAEVDFEPLDFMDPKKARRLDRFSQFSLGCAMMALADAGLTPADAARNRMGIYVGSALGGIAFGEEQHAVFMERGTQIGRAHV